MKSPIGEAAAAALLLAGCLPVLQTPSGGAAEDSRPYFLTHEIRLVSKVSEGMPMEMALVAENPAGGELRFEVVQGPPGMSVEGEVLRWTPVRSDRGNHPVKVRVVGRRDLADTLAWTLNVNRPPEFLQDSAFLRSSAGQHASYALRVEDRDGDTLSFRLLDSLPGMRIEDGRFQWYQIPAPPGIHEYRVAAVDGRGGIDTLLIILNMNRSPVWADYDRVDTLVIGQALTRDFAIRDPDGDSLYFYLMGRLPGVTLQGTRVSVLAGDCLESWQTVQVVAQDRRGGADTTGWRLLIVRREEPAADPWRPGPGEIERRGQMVRVEAQGRSFAMGWRCDSSSLNSYSHFHRVAFSYDFWMDTTEVTAEDYLRTLGITVSHAYPEPKAAVRYVNWYDAALYCNARSKLEGLDTVYTYTGKTFAFDNHTLDSVRIHMGRNGYRLPTSAEWEYAARGGTFQRYYWGYDTAMAVAGRYEWYSEYVPGAEYPPRPAVGRKLPNPYGLHDMLGNTAEWVNDWMSLDRPPAEVSDPPGALAPRQFSAGTRILRGGSRHNKPEHIPLHMIRNGGPGQDSEETGFRAVLPARIPEGFRDLIIR